MLVKDCLDWVNGAATSTLKEDGAALHLGPGAGTKDDMSLVNTTTAPAS